MNGTKAQLATVNEEMLARNGQTNRLADDLSNIINSLDIAVLLLDRELRVRRVTPAAAALFGLESGDTGRQLSDLARPFVTHCVDLTRQVLTAYQIVTRTVRDEAGRWYLLSARPYFTADQKVDGALITGFNVDAVAGTSFRDVLAGASEGILLVESSGRILFANQACAALFGYTPDELLGAPIETLVPDSQRADHDQWRQRFQAVASTRPMARNREVLGLKKDGSTVPLEVTLNPSHGPHGQLVVAFIRDVTERRRAQLEIDTYQSRLQHMAFDTALAEERERRRIALDLHDRIAQGLALARIKLSSARDATTGSVRDAVDDAMLLLAQSLESTRTLTFDLSPPILYDLGLKEALSWLAEDLENRFGLSVQLNMDARPTPLEDASAALVFRAVRELLLNVLKHAQSPHAQLTVRSSHESVEICVEDSGVGFDPSSPRKSGFGLFSVREQIERLGGSLDLVSALERGTRITLKVPLGRGPSAPAPNPAPQP